jgi:hypothetical protein
VQEQSRGTTDVKRNTASTARFLLKLWDYSVGRVWTALINVVKGIFGKKNEPFGSKDSPVKFLSEERTSVLPPIAYAATEAAAFDEDRVSIRQRENLLEARRLMEQKLREIDGRPRRVVAGLQLEMSNQEAVDDAEDVGGDGILPSAELTTAMPMNGPDEDTTAAMEYGAINALAAMPENDTTSAVGYGAIDALANIPEEDVIAVSEVTSDAVINGMFVCCCDVIVSAILCVGLMFLGGGRSGIDVESDQVQRHQRHYFLRHHGVGLLDPFSTTLVRASTWRGGCISDLR